MRIDRLEERRTPRSPPARGTNFGHPFSLFPHLLLLSVFIGLTANKQALVLGLIVAVAHYLPPGETAKLVSGTVRAATGVTGGTLGLLGLAGPRGVGMGNAGAVRISVNVALDVETQRPLAREKRFAISRWPGGRDRGRHQGAPILPEPAHSMGRDVRGHGRGVRL
jgi:hypothetical protein